MAVASHKNKPGPINTHASGLLAENRPVRLHRVTDLAHKLAAKGMEEDAQVLTRMVSELGRLRWLRATAWNELEKPPKTSEAEDHDSNGRKRERKASA